VTDDSAPQSHSFPPEVAVVWALFAVVTAEIFVTYWRLPTSELYHVSHDGLAGGASRALVFLNFPLALVAIPIIVLLLGRLPDARIRALGLVGIVLSAVIFWPGIVKQSDLDARPVNAIAALGVAIAALLTVVAARALGRPARPWPQIGDRLRVLLAVAILIAGVPWIAADLGVHFNGVPVLGSLYQTGELRTQPGDPVAHPAVHYGHHHGMDGVLLVLTALLLSRVLAQLRAAWLRLTLGFYVSLMLCYGAGNVANDFWIEQVVKRDWTDWEIPDVTTPKASVAWAVILASAVALWALSIWRVRTLSDHAVPTANPETA
jgi:hypothetical protein